MAQPMLVSVSCSCSISGQDEQNSQDARKAAGGPPIPSLLAEGLAREDQAVGGGVVGGGGVGASPAPCRRPR